MIRLAVTKGWAFCFVDITVTTNSFFFSFFFFVPYILDTFGLLQILMYIALSHILQLILVNSYTNAHTCYF